MAKKRQSGIEAVGDVPWGTHLCVFYHTREDLIELLVPYFKAGLESNEFCMWVTSEPLPVEDARRSLAGAVANLDDYLEKGQIEILDYSEWYTSSGQFDAAEVLQGWIDKEQEAVERGFDGLRLTGNTFWLEERDWAAFVNHEATVDRVIGRHRMLAICTYSLDRCGVLELLDVARDHERALLRRRGRWEAIASATRAEAERALGERAKELACLFAVSRDMQEDLSLDEFCGRVVEHLVPAMQFPEITVPVLELNGRRFTSGQHTEGLSHGLHAEIEVAGECAGQLWIYYAEDRPFLEPGEQNLVNAVAQLQGRWLQRKRAGDALRESEERHRALFDSVSVGLYRTTPAGQILDTNPAAVSMLGYEDRESLLAANACDVYVNPEDRARWQALMDRDGEVRDFEAQWLRRDGEIIWVKDSARAVRDAGGRVLHYAGSLEDITERKRAESQRNAAQEALRVSQRFLEIANGHTEMNHLLQEFVANVRNFTGCAAAGLRVLDEEGNIPYEAYEGFSQSFYESESPLSVRSDECMCINVIKGTTDPKLSFYTESGSFYMNWTTRFLATVSEEEKGRTRNVCNQAGYESVALVPIRLGDNILGLIHVADYHENMVPLETVEVLEGAAMQLGTAIQRVRAEQALRESEGQLRALVESSADHIFILGLDGSYLFSNDQVSQFGLESGESLVGRHLRDVHSPEVVDLYQRQLEHVVSTGQPRTFEHQLLEPDEERHRLDTLYPIRRNGELWAVGGICHDITERKRAEEALHRSLEEAAHGQQMLLALSQSAQAVQRARTPDQVYQTVGDEIGRLGYHATLFVLTDDRACLAASYMTFAPKLLRTAERLTGLSARGYRFRLEPGGFYERLVVEGEPVFSDPGAGPIAEALPRPVRPLAGRLAALLGVEKAIYVPLQIGGETQSLLTVMGAGLTEADVPAMVAFANEAAIAIENARLAEEVRTRSTDLERLSARLFSAQEEERRRLSLELHDELGQALTGMGFDLAAIEREWPPEVAPATTERLAKIGSLLAEIDERVSDMALDLRPQMLDDLGLLPTLRWHVNRYSRRMGIDVELEAVDFEERLTPEVATAVYRMVQEALTNVAKHAEASRIAVRLERRESTVAAVVQDDGRGFEMDELIAHHLERGAGLLGMRERVALLGGTFDIQSRPGQGTRVTIEIPI